MASKICSMVRGGGHGPSTTRPALRPLAQLERAGEVEVAPGARLGLIPELIEGVGLQKPGGLVGRIGEHEMVEKLCGPAVIARIGRCLGLAHDLVGASHRLDVANSALSRRVGVEVGGVAVEPAEVALVHGL